jgi:hypothetical protein
MSSRKPTRGNVFRTTKGQNLVAADRLLVAFHRGTAILYALVAVWGVAIAAIGLPSLHTVFGPELQRVYAVTVAVVAAASAYAATYFPKRSRFELYSASTLVTLWALYPVTLATLVITGNAYTYSGPLVLSLTFLAIPAVRIDFVYRWMIQQSAAHGGSDGGE